MRDKDKALNETFIWSPLTLREHCGRGERPNNMKMGFKTPYCGQNTAVEIMNSQQPWMFSVGLHKNVPLNNEAWAYAGHRGPILQRWIIFLLIKSGEGAITASGCAHSPHTLKTPTDCFSSMVTLRALDKLDGQKNRANSQASGKRMGREGGGVHRDGRGIEGGGRRASRMCQSFRWITPEIIPSQFQQ